jgi:hypothetical protein
VVAVVLSVDVHGESILASFRRSRLHESALSVFVARHLLQPQGTVSDGAAVAAGRDHSDGSGVAEATTAAGAAVASSSMSSAAAGAAAAGAGTGLRSSGVCAVDSLLSLGVRIHTDPRLLVGVASQPWIEDSFEVHAPAAGPSTAARQGVTQESDTDSGCDSACAGRGCAVTCRREPWWCDHRGRCCDAGDIVASTAVPSRRVVSERASNRCNRRLFRDKTYRNPLALDAMCRAYQIDDTASLLFDSRCVVTHCRGTSAVALAVSVVCRARRSEALATTFWPSRQSRTSSMPKSGKCRRARAAAMWACHQPLVPAVRDQCSDRERYAEAKRLPWCHQAVHPGVAVLPRLCGCPRRYGCSVRWRATMLSA